ncbi:MAG: hypothetical protein JWR50_2131 [Mucilaginibacter sp.]|nr:hypothetical protein [Mucilaginibacter sp.]
MANWSETAEFAGFGLFMLVTLYMIIHMIYNKIKGRDELDSVFRFRKRNKDKT